MSSCIGRSMCSDSIREPQYSRLLINSHLFLLLNYQRWSSSSSEIAHPAFYVTCLLGDAHLWMPGRFIKSSPIHPWFLNRPPNRVIRLFGLLGDFKTTPISYNRFTTLTPLQRLFLVSSSTTSDRHAFLVYCANYWPCRSAYCCYCAVDWGT